MTTAAIIKAFYANLEKKDFAAISELLDDEFSFAGPMAQVSGRAEFVEMLAKTTQATTGYRVKHLFVDGDKACCVFEFLTATPIAVSPSAEYFTVTNGRIASLEAHFDAHPWVTLMGQNSQ